MATKRTAQTKITNFFIFTSPKIIVLVDGLAIGTFNTPAQALTWAYEHCKDGIFQLKELIDPRIEM